MAHNRSLIVSSGIWYVKNKLGQSDFYLSNQFKPGLKLRFQKGDKRFKLFNDYKRICREKSPISRRIRLFLLEYSQSLREIGFHERQLGFWRCLEIATKKGERCRSQEDMIKILSNYYKQNSSWGEKGQIILKMRNDFIHDGILQSQQKWKPIDRYLNWSQQYVDAALSILLWLRSNNIGKDCSREIDDFFNFYSETNNSLKIAAKLYKNLTKSAEVPA